MNFNIKNRMREGWLERPAVSRSTSPFSIGEMLQRLFSISVRSSTESRARLKKKKLKRKFLVCKPRSAVIVCVV